MNCCLRSLFKFLNPTESVIADLLSLLYVIPTFKFWKVFLILHYLPSGTSSLIQNPPGFHSLLQSHITIHIFPCIFSFLRANLSSLESCSNSTLFLRLHSIAYVHILLLRVEVFNGWWSSCYITYLPQFIQHATPRGSFSPFLSTLSSAPHQHP